MHEQRAFNIFETLKEFVKFKKHGIIFLSKHFIYSLSLIFFNSLFFPFTVTSKLHFLFAITSIETPDREKSNRSRSPVSQSAGSFPRAKNLKRKHDKEKAINEIISDHSFLTGER